MFVSTPEAESSRLCLTPKSDRREVGLDVQSTELDEVRNILSIFIESSRLWFRIEYDIGGVRRGLSPSDFIAARSDRRVKDEILGVTASEIHSGGDVVITMINPRSPEM